MLPENIKAEKRRVESNNSRTYKKGLKGTMSHIEWAFLLAHHGFRCAYCGAVYETMDHIVPVVNGGGTTYTNILPCCHDCNQKKGTAVWLPAKAGDYVTVTAVLTDGEDTYDSRHVITRDLGWMNEVAQRETNGQLWWEVQHVVEREGCGLLWWELQNTVQMDWAMAD